MRRFALGLPLVAAFLAFDCPRGVSSQENAADSGSGGASSGGGGNGNGGSSAGGASSGGNAGNGTGGAGSSDDSSGCGCGVPRARNTLPLSALVALAFAMTRRRQVRRIPDARTCCSRSRKR